MGSGIDFLNANDLFYLNSQPDFDAPRPLMRNKKIKSFFSTFSAFFIV